MPAYLDPIFWVSLAALVIVLTLVGMADNIITGRLA